MIAAAGSTRFWLSLAAAGATALAVACGDSGGDGGGGPGPAVPTLAISGGDLQTDTVGRTLPQPLAVVFRDTLGQPVSGATVTWSVVTGGGSVTASSVTATDGVAGASYTVGTEATVNSIRAFTQGAAAPVFFTVHAVNDVAAQLVKAAGDSQFAVVGGSTQSPYAVKAVDQYGNAVPQVSVQWSVTGGGGSVSSSSSITDASGIARTTHTLAATGDNTVQATAGGLAGSPVTFISRGVLPATYVAEVGVPENYGAHDTFVRDGIAFLCAWNTGVIILDVGNGIRGGSPSNPVEISRLVPSDNGVPGGPAVHNAWWFHNPNTGEARYLFLGQEGPLSVGSAASGDIHVVDVSDLANPVEVAYYHMAGAGTHNFWMDEANQILYAAYYNGGVVALSVSGTLSGNLANREIARVKPGGNGTFTWGVHLYNGSLYASDMTRGFFQLKLNGFNFNVLAGTNPVTTGATTDLWVANGYAYTGVGFRSNPAVMIWRLDASGAPVLVDSLFTPSGLFNLSDVEVSPGGNLLMFSTEAGPNGGFYFYNLADPARPVFLSRYQVTNGIHTATFGEINGRLYAFGARNPSGPAMVILDVTTLDF
ncbi:MAG: Ig-like domain-containing protein [Gemmatimonadales bacterium]